MSVLAAERIKLFSTRSPWWCSGSAIVIVVGFTALLAGTSSAEAGPLPFDLIGSFVQLGLMIVLVMAAVSVTTEYRFSTIRTTFQAVPNRTLLLLAKATVVALVAAVVGLVAAFGAWGAAVLLAPTGSLALDSPDRWRALLGAGLVFAVAAVLAVAVGILLRQTGGAVALLLVWALLAENLVRLIPNVGEEIQRWMPFVNADHFLTVGVGDEVEAASSMPFGPWGSLAYFAAIAAGMLVAALVVANRRDA